MADLRAWEVYADHGRVTGLEATETAVTAVALGSSPYRVANRLADGALLFDCSCPMGDDRAFCKHLVAVGLEVTGDPTDLPDAPPTDALATLIEDLNRVRGGDERAAATSTVRLSPPRTTPTPRWYACSR